MSLGLVLRLRKVCDSPPPARKEQRQKAPLYQMSLVITVVC